MSIWQPPKLFSGTRFPNKRISIKDLVNVRYRLTAYVCEQLNSVVNMNKSQFRYQLTNAQVTQVFET